MPIKKICPRCHKIIDAQLRYCEPCQAKVTAWNNKQYDANRRNKQSRDFYHSPEWLRVRELIILKSKGVDLYAYIVHKRIVKANTVHHINELAEAWDERFDIGNLIAVSDSSHKEIHKAYNRGVKDKADTKALLKQIVTSEFYNPNGEGVSETL